MMRDLKYVCQKEAPNLTCRTEYLGANVRVIDWKKKGKTRKSRQGRSKEFR